MQLVVPSTIHGFAKLKGHLDSMYEDNREEWVWWMREYSQASRYFLLRYVLSTRNMKLMDDGVHPLDRKFILDRCRDTQRKEHDVLDIWSREHYKSTIKTFAGLIQRVIIDPNATICILTHRKDQSVKFLNRLKLEMKGNKLLKTLFPEVFWESPDRDAPRWSSIEGLTVQRSSNVPEATFEGHGFLDGLPIGSHYDVLAYDDIVTGKSVNTEEIMIQTNDMWEASLSLGKYGNHERIYSGTRYHSADTYGYIIEKEAADLRRFPCWDENEKPLLYPKEYIIDKQSKMTGREFACQWLCDPLAGEDRSFDLEDIRYYDTSPEEIRQRCNVYILADPATKKKKTSDYTVYVVVGLGANDTVYILDIVRDRLNPAERIDELFRLVKYWGPVIEVRYEEYAMQTDIFWIQREMDRRGHFEIMPVRGNVKKEDRISNRLQPMFNAHRIYFPRTMIHKPHYADGRDVDMTKLFLNEEYLRFPLSGHDDMLDALSRISEEDGFLVWPNSNKDGEGRWDRAFRKAREAETGELTWMSA